MGGGERRMYERWKAEGSMCSECHTLLDMGPWRKGPRTCDVCKTIHTVMLQWSYADGAWSVMFFDTRLKCALGKLRRYDKPDPIIGMVMRSRRPPTGPKEMSFQNEVKAGVGQWPIEITDEQYRKILG